MCMCGHNEDKIGREVLSLGRSVAGTGGRTHERTVGSVDGRARCGGIPVDIAFVDMHVPEQAPAMNDGLHASEGSTGFIELVDDLIVDCGAAGEVAAQVCEGIHRFQLSAILIDLSCMVGGIGRSLMHNHYLLRVDAQYEVVPSGSKEVHAPLHVLFCRCIDVQSTGGGTGAGGMHCVSLHLGVPPHLPSARPPSTPGPRAVDQEAKAIWSCGRPGGEVLGLPYSVPNLRLRPPEVPNPSLHSNDRHERLDSLLKLALRVAADTMKCVDHLLQAHFLIRVTLTYESDCSATESDVRCYLQKTRQDDHAKLSQANVAPRICMLRLRRSI
ncbi:unnamed protein product [Schistocephalus solidus]|uniref:Uncharacterized protein n=1 Tax=Schistocephalus solidus TaxID=70667 RepID=A0A183T0E3_SCHSO|nr:unnamed protein product [Schistocephalus solidus]